MKVVSDASPLIALARIDCLVLLPRLYRRIAISTEVYAEIVVGGAGLPGAKEIANARWIEVHSVSDTVAMAEAIRKTGLGVGEVSAVSLAREIGGDLILIDERRARRYARAEGFDVIGCIGVLETLHRRGHLANLREAYIRLLDYGFRIDREALQESLARLELPLL